MKTDRIRTLLALVDAQAEVVRRVEHALAALKLQAGQAQSMVTINGVTFSLTNLGRETGWMPQIRSDMLEMTELALRMTTAQLAQERVKLEGLEWRVKQAVKE